MILYSDVPLDAGPGVELAPVTDPGPPIEAAGSLLELIGNTPAGSDGPHRPGPVRPAVCQARVPQPRQQHQRPTRPGHDRGRRGRGAVAEGRHHRRTNLGQHRGGTGHRGRSPRLPLHFHHAGQDRGRKGGPAPGLRSRGGGVPDGRGPGPPRLLLLGGPAPERVDARVVHAQPVRQSGQPGRPRAQHRPGAVAPDRRAYHPPGGEHRHGGDDQRGGSLSEGPEPRHPDHRSRSGGVGVLRRPGPALPGRRDRRGLLAVHVRPRASPTGS